MRTAPSPRWPTSRAGWCSQPRWPPTSNGSPTGSCACARDGGGTATTPATALHAAVVEVAANAPAYRSYVRFEDDDPSRPVASPTDEAFVRTAVDGARRSAPGLDPELLDLLQQVLLGRLRGDDEAEVALRFQQLTGPVAAKGEEDTALYRWLPLPHRCEVGADPSTTSIGADDLARRLRRRPGSVAPAHDRRSPPTTRSARRTSAPAWRR